MNERIRALLKEIRKSAMRTDQDVYTSLADIEQTASQGISILEEPPAVEVVGLVGRLVKLQEEFFGCYGESSMDETLAEAIEALRALPKWVSVEDSKALDELAESCVMGDVDGEAVVEVTDLQFWRASSPNLYAAITSRKAKDPATDFGAYLDRNPPQ